MPKLIILGSSNAIPDRDHENTHMVLVGKSSTVLIDCVNNAILRLEQAGIDFNNLTDLVLTHFHPDHVSGVPQLLMNMWLLGRSRTLNVHGLDHTIERIEAMMGLYSWSEWPNFFPVKFHRVAEQEAAPVFAGDEFSITATPVQHFIPTIGLRIEFHASNKTLAYSCDTEPCPQVIRLAAGADTLIHEASGPVPGHSSAGQAGEAARQAEVGELYLIHYPTGRFAKGDLVAEAGARFGGPVRLATDFMTLEF
jgi:ribonuclease Z